MSQIVTQDGITFSKYKTDSEYLPVNGGIKVSNATGVDPIYGGIVNAVDIDWNEAQINGATMTTSGEVVNAIK